MKRKVVNVLYIITGCAICANALSQEAPASPAQHLHHEAAPPPSPPQDHPHHSQSMHSTASNESTHVPPAPPQHELGDMPYDEMAEMMQMDDAHPFGKVVIDQAEWREANSNSEFVWDGKAWLGGDINKLLVRTEGEHVDGNTEEARVEFFWDRVISRWWTLQAGAREDLGVGPSRTWVALGVEGSSPLWFDVEATLYAGEQGRTAARIKVEHDMLLTRRLVLQPELEANLYGKADHERQIGSGLSDVDVGLRLRYEIRREIAPYIGIAWRRLFGDTADFVHDAGEDDSELQFLAGLRVWF